MGSIHGMDILQNPHRHIGLTVDILRDIPAPSTDSAAVQALLARCPNAAETKMLQAPNIAQDLNIAQLSVKDERGRMGLGSFKALGAAYVIAHSAIVKGEAQSAKTYVTASAGNHGLSVAAGAKAFGAASVIFLSQSVPEAFAKRLIAHGATVERAGATYEQTFTDVVLERSCVSKRSATEILKDLAGGYITAQAAEALYGLAPKQIANALA